jgi:hypothetical protein
MQGCSIVVPEHVLTKRTAVSFKVHVVRIEKVIDHGFCFLRLPTHGHSVQCKTALWVGASIDQVRKQLNVAQLCNIV